MQGRFEILCLSGSYTFSETGGVRRRNGMLNISMAKPNGEVVGGGVAGALIAAGPIQVSPCFSNIFKIGMTEYSCFYF
jgi:hypothetical protein